MFNKIPFLGSKYMYVPLIIQKFSHFFQAVVNEDTQGNVLSLQQEIKRLKDQLSAFMSGNLTAQPGVTGN